MTSRFVKISIALLTGMSLVAVAQETRPTLEELFLGSAQITNAFAIESARVALQKPSSAAVKSFAQTLLNDHTRAQQSVSSLFEGIYAGGGSLGPSSSGDNRPDQPRNDSPRTPTPSGGDGRVSGGSALTNTPSAGQTIGGGAPGTGATNNTSASTRVDGQSTPASSAQSIPSVLSSLSYDQQLRLRSLSSLSGAAFNSAFATEQVSAHETAVRNIRFAAQRLNDARMNIFAQQYLVTLEKNLRTARGLPR
jgi:predicted outer membrane protein